MRAIVSVSDKSGVVDFAKGLLGIGAEIYSTGGTKKSLQDAKVKVHSISELTGFPEILDGRVKTLHPSVHGGILARRDLLEHMSELEKNNIAPIDLIVVNLYPFVQTVSRKGVTIEEALENIDIGGPTMIRAAAKNYPSVLVIVDPEDYGPILEKLVKGKVEMPERKRLAQKAFQHVAMYDTAIAQYLRDEPGFPPVMTIALKKKNDLRYGENPHQKAAFYSEQVPGQAESGMAALVQHHGPELSFNNILDIEAAYKAVTDFNAPTMAVIKHNNPCGLSSHKDLTEAYRRALAGDPLAAFGGVVASNRVIDMTTATEMYKTHYDAMIAPGYSDDALTLFKGKKNMRIVSLPLDKLGSSTLDYRKVGGGFLVQVPDFMSDAELKPKTVTKRAPTESEMLDLLFAWRAVKYVKSNAIVIARDETLMGMGAGQPSRVVSAQIAMERAGDRAKGGAVGSDAFFPFPDGVELLARGGVTAIIQPGGSIRDQEAIDMADKYNIAMVFTGIRHFRH
jgi:phosphoribosylaminoimidazolecarboxamide formyltransferase/IMP cyclohydrolase